MSIIDIFAQLGLVSGILTIMTIATRAIWVVIKPKIEQTFDRHILLIDKLVIKLDDIPRIINQHDEHQIPHHEACYEAGKRIENINQAAIIACNEAEAIAKQYGIEGIEERINRIRQALEFK